MSQKAGEQRWAEARRLLQALLEEGWVELCEQIRKGEWLPQHVRWLRREVLEAALGMPNLLDIGTGVQRLRTLGFADSRLIALADSVSGLRPDLQLRRMHLLHKLDAWLASDQVGTRRQFALAARNDTKGITEAEWKWLDESLGLETLGIEAHTPGLWLRAPIRLSCADGILDLRAVPDAIAITPATFAAAKIEGSMGCWRVVENRTSFEQAARAHGAKEGVLWLPGFAPKWWRAIVSNLLKVAPAPLWISCDPDPAGIRIALSVAELWEEHGLQWQPWRMSSTDLLSLSAHRPLNDYDRAEILRISDHPSHTIFAGLICALTERGKGEQEGLDLGL
ncbi:DUF2399 domain-containing protein [Lysobacter changpingensis]|uniref:DUF2399 domain-containing protein n=1 Tax=Lysobacter changpingensis TaxID=2792784 RepID=UPI001A8EDF19|nr:DUF2399 domain-containing protein [Lysobacter changpingensis]